MGSLLNNCVPTYKKNPETSAEDAGNLTKRDSVMHKKRQIKSVQGPVENYETQRPVSVESESEHNQSMDRW